MKKIKELANEYGRWALGTYLVIFALAMVGFSIAIKLGFEVEGVAGNAGVLAGAWVACKATQPLRIAATVGLTPIVARLFRAKRPESAEPEAAPSEPKEPEAAPIES